MYHFDNVYDSFLSSFKKFMFGNNTSILSLEEEIFLEKKGNIESNEQYSILKVYCSRKSPIYLPFYVANKIFIVEVCKKYRFWANFFYERKNIKFIPFLWK